MKTIKLDNGDEIEVTGMSLDSRAIQQGDVFCACASSIAPSARLSAKLSQQLSQLYNQNKQANRVGTHGIAYAGQAINQGARVILWEPTAEIMQMPKTCHSTDGRSEAILIAVDNLHQKIGKIAADFYGDASQDMQVIGVTGTNGKTSVTHFISQSLSESGQACGVIGTLGNGLYGNLSASTHTTPDAISVQNLLSQIKTEQANSVAIEVSSHALDQLRVADVKFDMAIFMNLTRDHLDYHGSMENYADAKKKLFLMKSLSTAIINLEDDFSKEISQSIDLKRVKLIGFSSKDIEDTNYSSLYNNILNTYIYAEKINYQAQGSQFNLCIIDNQKATNKIIVTLPLIGHFNITNALATAATLYAMGYEIKQIAIALGKVKTVAGRMQLITHAEKAVAQNQTAKETNKTKAAQLIVDYAHTPDALEKALKAIQNHGHKNIFCVFGCGGNRDKGKRAEMAVVAAKYADHIVITSDNPRDEDPMAIIADIETGFQANQTYKVEVDRTKAIKLAIDLSAQGDIILVAGKGHEDYQEINGVKHPYSDIESCQRLLAA